MQLLFWLFIILLMMLFGYYCVLLLMIFMYQPKVDLSDLKACDYLVVLGGKTIGNRPGPIVKQRLNCVLDILKFTDAKVIVSGGKNIVVDEVMAEGNVMRNYLLVHGVDKSRILVDDESLNTWENLKYSSYFIDVENDNVIVVSSDFHLFRIMILSNKLGYKWKFFGSKTINKLKFIRHEARSITMMLLFYRKN